MLPHFLAPAPLGRSGSRSSDGNHNHRVRKRRYSARPFFLTVLLIFTLATISYLRGWTTAGYDGGRTGSIQRRDAGVLRSADEECRLVHKATDQCAFVLAHCPQDEDMGFYSYLTFYYCRLNHAKPVAFIILVLWLGLLFSTIGIAASDFFCVNLSTIASILGMSESMAGVTLLAFGNGSPDVFSTFAAMSTNSGSLAIGELMGAAGFITAVVAGSMALVRPFKVAKKSFVRDVCFFIVAASFSMVFLYDGRLHLWECIVMVGFYVFYVGFVLIWHWHLGQRKRKREKEAAARGHFLTPGSEDTEVQEEYHDDEDDRDTRPDISRGASSEDFSTLERGGTTTPRIVEPEDDDEEDEARERWLNELSSNMRLSRPGYRTRRNTITPIRPSLVGALEFQTVFKSLQRSRNIQTIPMDSRRYSDAPTYTGVQEQDQTSSSSDPASHSPYRIRIDEARRVSNISELSSNSNPTNRSRAVSADDADRLRIHTNLILDRFQLGAPNVRSFAEDGGLRPPEATPGALTDEFVSPRSPMSPSITLSPAPSESGVGRSTSQRSRTRRLTSDMLAPPEPADSGVQHYHQPALGPSYFTTQSPHDSPGKSLPQSPRTELPGKSRRSSASSPSSPFPPYSDDPTVSRSRPPSLHLPPPGPSPESSAYLEDEDRDVEEKPLRWWPYKVLPPPSVLVSTLFPTLYHWKDRNLWEKMLAVVAAPSVFLLTITLPVVDTDKDSESELDCSPDVNQPTPIKSHGHAEHGKGSIVTPKSDSLQVQPSAHPHSHNKPPAFGTDGVAGRGNSASAATVTEASQHYPHVPDLHQEQQPLLSSAADYFSSLPTQLPVWGKQSQPWNRWLTITQLFFAPVACVFAISLQAPDLFDDGFLVPVLISLVVSLVLLLVVLTTTTPTHRPTSYTIVLALAGFTVSISWISSIASQVVALLKALAIIANMSHAILGLTVFAVGNSLGDLVADITVARLGYPVMALSACFGGPMLNILLGIGISGCYMLVRSADHRYHKHPEKGVYYKSYEIEVGGTLIVSGVTLLVTLVGLLVAVPWNNWVMSRRIGWALIALWTVSTIGNVVLEATGWAESGSEG
ncbi:hypothetical protein LTR50_005366 [Elasticomyces elasticus]|nr:hypothetical protein LTR50_005366 [Elasticomyces elasticus]